MAAPNDVRCDEQCDIFAGTVAVCVPSVLAPVIRALLKVIVGKNIADQVAGSTVTVDFIRAIVGFLDKKEITEFVRYVRSHVDQGLLDKATGWYVAAKFAIENRERLCRILESSGGERERMISELFKAEPEEHLDESSNVDCDDIDEGWIEM